MLKQLSDLPAKEVVQCLPLKAFKNRLGSPLPPLPKGPEPVLSPAHTRKRNKDKKDYWRKEKMWP